MSLRIALPQINVAQSLRNGGEAFLHLLHDAAQVNGNIYGDHQYSGEGGSSAWTLFNILMKGCEFYSTDRSSGGDIFALMAVSTLGAIPYLGWRVLSDSVRTAGYQIGSGINDAYLDADYPLDVNDTNRHDLAKYAVGFPGLVVGGLARVGIYGLGLFGVSSFGYHSAAKAFKNCINFICDKELPTDSHAQYLDKPRNIPATVLKHVNLIQITNIFGYVVTAGCGVLGLTAYSLRFASDAWGSTYNAMFGAAPAEQPEPLGQEPVAELSWTKKAARYGLLGLGLAGIGAVTIGFVKTANLTCRFLGISDYGLDLMWNAFKRCVNFIFATNYRVTDEPNAAVKTWADGADRVSLLVRLSNIFGYVVTAGCGVLGLTAHSMNFVGDVWSRTHDAMFGAEQLEPPEQQQQPVAELSWTKKAARYGLLGLGLAGIGAVTIGFVKTANLTCRFLGISDYGLDLMWNAFKRCVNFIFATNYRVTDEPNAAVKTWADGADRVSLLVRLSNIFGYVVTAGCGVLGLTAQSMNFVGDVWSRTHDAMFGVVQPSEANEVAVELSWKQRAKQAARYGLLGLGLAGIGAVTIGFVKTANLTCRFLGISDYGLDLMWNAFKRCVNFIFATNYRVTDEPNAAVKTWADGADRVSLLVRLSNIFGYVVTAGCGVLGLTAHSMNFVGDVWSRTHDAMFGAEQLEPPEQQQQQPVAELSWTKKAARYGLLGLGLAGIGAVTIGFVKTANLTCRFLGISDYGLDLMWNAFKRCVNFIFATNYRVTDEPNAAVKTWADGADRVSLLVRLSNIFGYVVTAGCGVLGLTAQSMNFVGDVWSRTHDAMFGVVQPAEANEVAVELSWKQRAKQAARYGLLGLGLAGIGAVTIGFVKTANLTCRFLGISDYGLDLMWNAFKRCVNFIFATNHPVTDEPNAAVKTWADGADRVSLLVRLSNIFGYVVTAGCGVLGLTAHSMNFVGDVWSRTHDAMFGAEQLEPPEQQQQPVAELSWTKKAARYGLLGLGLAGIGAVTIGFVKTANLTCRFLGISDYGLDLMWNAFKRCVNFIFATNYRVTDEPNAAVKTWADGADRVSLLVRLSNIFGYVVTAGCGVLGLTAHSMNFVGDVWSRTHDAMFGAEQLEPPEQQQQPVAELSWTKKAARYGLLGLGLAGIGAVTIGFVKTANLTCRFLGISDYGLDLMWNAFKRCVNFIFATNYRVTDEPNAAVKTWADGADRVSLLVRLSNIFGYVVTAGCGVLGLTAQSMNFVGDVWSRTHDAMFGVVQPSEANEVAVELSWKQRAKQAARYGLLGLGLAGIGAVTIGFVKTANLTCRFLGISDYGLDLMRNAFKRCVNFIFATNYRVTDEPNAAVKTWADGADRVSLLVRLSNIFGYVVTAGCGVLGLTAHSMNFASDVLTSVYQFAFGTAVAPVVKEGEGQSTEGLVPASEEPDWKKSAAKFGALGIVSIVVGSCAIACAKAFSLLGKVLGFSAYSGNLISYTFKKCANFVFGTSYNTDAEKAIIDAPALTLADKADRVGLFAKALNGFGYAISGVLGVLGFTASTYHQGAWVVKYINHMFDDKNEEQYEAEQKPHNDFLEAMKNQNMFTKIASRFNLVSGVAVLGTVAAWGACAVVSFAVRRVWKLTLGNIIGDACGPDGTFNSTSNEPPMNIKQQSDPVEKLNRHFRDLLWCLDPSTGELPSAGEGQNQYKTYQQAKEDARNMNLLQRVGWRISYEIKKSGSVFGLNGIQEKVILHFAAEFQEYVRVEQARSRTERSINWGDNIALTFFGNGKYDNMVNEIKGHYKRQRDKDLVDNAARAIQDEVVAEMQVVNKK